ncbi:hypothetical protein ACN38_g2523 [Penicillium nordicum]|uniref:Uncharacterized protein n=1 Tax=Penicillium nordicum TaxID=229535 RepID=A0A0M8PDM0_9EURO|nr:hypothetical protein ACN38_g2523 [Penicillium nordicum]
MLLVGLERVTETLRSCDSEMEKQHGRIRLRAEGRRGEREKEREREKLSTTCGSVSCGAICLGHPCTQQNSCWVPGCLRPRAPLGTDPLCAVDSLSFSPFLLLLSVQPQPENPTVLFLQSQPRRFSVNSPFT